MNINDWLRTADTLDILQAKQDAEMWDTALTRARSSLLKRINAELDRRGPASVRASLLNYSL